ncbi:fimbrillin family protein [Bacteroides sp. AN502(2024)]|uniref:fimbrillin family protein n=1 Tax=Bacteroides sp. AN502(2024) TaxID=3160599 RepID=UPI0035183941
MRKSFLLTVWSIGLFTGCSQTDEWSVDDSVMDNRQIQLSVGVDNLQTRAGYDGNNLDAFQLIIDHPSSEIFSYNLLMQKTGDVWNSADNESLFWDPNESAMPVCAFAPAQSGASLTGSLAINVPVDQSTEAKLKSADFLLTKKMVNFLEIGGKLDITLKHKLCKLLIHVVDGGAEVKDLKVVGAILQGTCDLTLEAPVVTPAATAGTASVTPLKNNADNTYECILLPQDAGKLVVAFTIGDAFYEWKFKQAQLAEGTCYELTINVATSETQLKAFN